MLKLNNKKKLKNIRDSNLISKQMQNSFDIILLLMSRKIPNYEIKFLDVKALCAMNTL